MFSYEAEKLELLADYVEAFGININIGRTKARGNKGIFIQKHNKFRIDISKQADNPIGTVIHEFAHYVHSIYDKKLKSLDFIFSDFSDEINEELIKVTVSQVPQDFAKGLFEHKKQTEFEIKELAGQIKQMYPDFKLSEKNTAIEKTINYPEKYLIKYDKVRIFNKVLSVERSLSKLTSIQQAYILLKSKKRLINRINSKISRLNRYYNQPTELFARFVEMYFTQKERTKKLAPQSCEIMDKILEENKIKELSGISKIISC